MVNLDGRVGTRKDGSFQQTYCIIKDITRQKEIEVNLQRSSAMMQFVMDAMPSFIFWKDENCIYLGCNKNFANAAGVGTPENIVGKTDHDLAWKKEEADWFVEFDRMTMKEDKAYFNIVKPQKFADGKQAWINSNKAPLHDEEGNVIGVMGCYDDITEKLEAEKKLKESEEQLKQVQRLEAVGRLAGGIAHDINNLLTPILGFSELLTYDQTLSDTVKEKLNVMNTAAQGARDLIRQLLAFSRKQVLEVTCLNLNAVVDDFLPLLQRTIPEHIEIRTRKAASLSGVLCDRGQIEQLLMNLVVNGADAMPEGGTLSIETDVCELDETHHVTHPEVIPGNYVMLAVSDTGIGMDEETISQIFEPFFSTKGEFGTGLGLATVYGITRQHEGVVWVYSEPGRGSTFKVFLPVSEQPAVERKVSLESKDDLHGTEKILVVEDNETVRATVQDILQGYGYHVIAAESGVEAINVFDSGVNPDMILTDVVMQDMNGKEMFSKIAEQVPDIKILFMSGYADDIIVQHGVLEEGVNFIQKPFSANGLLKKVREVLESQVSSFNKIGRDSLSG